MSSPKQEQLDNTVLNVTVFEEVPDKGIGLPKHKTIDITNFLKDNGVTSFYQVNAITRFFNNKEDEYGSTPYETRFVIDEVRIRNLGKSIENIIDAAIVNSNQSKAVKKLIDDTIASFLSKCWETIV